LIHAFHLLTRCLLFRILAPPSSDVETLSLHDALPISCRSTWRSTPCHGSSARLRATSGTTRAASSPKPCDASPTPCSCSTRSRRDRKSTRLNSSHQITSYAVFCLKQKKLNMYQPLLVP